MSPSKTPPQKSAAPVGWQPYESYPDPNVQVLDQSFRKYVPFNAGIEKLATGMRWSEGPVWFGDARCLLWSDIPNNRIMRWDETTGAASVYRQPSNNSNGNTRDRQGRLVTCEHGGRRITRTEYDGSVTVLIDRFDGKRLNSPNDVVVKSDGTIWFTDPPFGISGLYEGDFAEPELPMNVYRLDPKTGKATVATSDVIGPNGLAFSPDEKKLYIVASRETPSRTIRVFDVGDNGRLSNNRVFINAGDGVPDGFRVDVDGNLWCGWGMSRANDGVMVFNADAEPIGKIALPERCANVCFGGARRNRLFMAASHSLYSLFTNAQGVAGG
jgi:gluconolactonase